MPIKHPFEYQAPTAAAVEDMTKVREACKALYEVLNDVRKKSIPYPYAGITLNISGDKGTLASLREVDSNNQAAYDYIKEALKSLEQVSMWANKAIVFADHSDAQS